MLFGLFVLLGLDGLLYLFVLSHCYPSFMSAFWGQLLGLIVNSVLSAEGTILVQLQTVGGILLVLHGVVVSLLALRAPEGDLDASAGLTCHVSAPPF